MPEHGDDFAGPALTVTRIMPNLKLLPFGSKVPGEKMLPAYRRLILNKLGFHWVEAKFTDQVGKEKMAKERHEKKAEVWCGMEAGQFVLEVPRRGHLEAVYHIYAYLALKHNTRLVMDPTYPIIDIATFKECDWREFYGDAREPIPRNVPPPRGKEVDLVRLFVDSDHAAGNKITRRSRSGFLIYLNLAPFVWFSKNQSTIETSVFVAEFVAMKHGVEVTRVLRYKLGMMGVSIVTPTYIYGDNMPVIHNTQRPESTLKKKSNSICYHVIRESSYIDYWIRWVHH